VSTSEKPRRARSLRSSSDQARSRGLLGGAVFGALLLVALLAWRHGARELVAPGPLARPHAGFTCTSCHAENTAQITCGGCHGPHPSSRSAHRSLAVEGTLTCGTCHAVHRSEAGIAFEPDGSVSIFDTGFDQVVVPPPPPIASVSARAANDRELTPSRLSSATLVPLVRAGACAECHDLDGARDPARSCVTGGADSFSLCFDEHRRPATKTASAATARDAALERARFLVRSRSVTAPLGAPRRLLAAGMPVALACGGALVFGLVLRRRSLARPTEPSGRAVVPGVRRLPVIDAARCLGCHACVDACPYDALGIRRYVAVLERPEACCGAGPCADACPNGSLTLLEGALPLAGPRLSNELEVSGRPGLFLAGDVTGSTLIRNAARQGVAVARAVHARLAGSTHGDDSPGSERVDLLVVGAGPAGLAAGLTARSLGLSVVVLDQAGVAASIRRFSRQKLVLDAASREDEALPLWLGDAPKEELLERWQRTLRGARLEVREGVRVTGVEGSGPFRIEAELADGARAGFRARHVLIAIGTRGTPRPLAVPVPEACVARVHYELSDARAFAGKRVVVIGLGDVAMESALALAAQPDTHVTIVHRGAGFSRGARRNIDAVGRLLARGRLRLVLGASVRALGVASLEIEVLGGVRSLPYDALFVHVGTVPARGLLESAGVAVRGEQG